MKIQSFAKSAIFWPVVLVSALVAVLVMAFVSKNDEARKLVSKIGEYIPADIIPQKTA